METNKRIQRIEKILVSFFEVLDNHPFLTERMKSKEGFQSMKKEIEEIKNES